jgi:Fe-S-cluster-containing hydrogenase component 2
MKTAVLYNSENCEYCLKCLRVCPTEAVTFENDMVSINPDKCINCGKCIQTCLTQALVTKGSTLVDIDSYDYTVCLVPSSLVCLCKTKDEIEDLFNAIKLLGFDEVFDISDVEAQVLYETRLLSRADKDKCYISSFCPVVNELIEVKYPSLLDNICSIDYPCEIKAKQIRAEKPEIKNLGIFNCCECQSKLLLAKYPFGNKKSNIDHALAIVDIFPAIKDNLKKGNHPISICAEGLQSINPNSIIRDDKMLLADGYDKIVNILELAEFGLLSKFDLLELFPCFNGCLGGNLLWGNSYLNENNIYKLYSECDKKMSNIPFNDIYTNYEVESKDNRPMKEKLEFFNLVNQQYDKLPQYDCGGCGFPSCRIMAEEIAKGNRNLDDCHILSSLKEKRNASK